MDSIFAVSSGLPPAAIAVLRISGPACQAVADLFHRGLPQPRRASLRKIVDSRGSILDEALILWFPGPTTATGEDLLEWHLHGGRAVVRAVEGALADIPGLRPAEPGEFTRRAFANGRIDLAEAEGLADLLSAETESQRINALRMAGGEFSRVVDRWTNNVLNLSARVEAAIDFDDEDDVAPLSPSELNERIFELSKELETYLSRPSVERIRDGIRVVLSGPPNAGKSSLFNAILRRDAAIVTSKAGTTRDVLEAPISVGGMAFVLIDTAGIHDHSYDEIEMEGIERARVAMATADLVLWLGDVDAAPPGAILVRAKADVEPIPDVISDAILVSSYTGYGLGDVVEHLIEHGRKILPQDGVALNRRQLALLANAQSLFGELLIECDLVIVAEILRKVRLVFDELTGRANTEAMLDRLFGQFCIGK